jgi:hypothetical protein
MGQNELPFDSRNLGVLSGMAKMNFMPVVHSTETMHLSDAEINTISKRTKATFHLTHVI